jgi:chorismate synthase
MLGCSYGRLFQTTVAGGSYQDGLSINIQGVPPGMMITEEEIYSSLLLRKPGQGELASPRREPDIPIIYSGINAANTMEGFENAYMTNGTPFVILVPNLDRHFEHIEQYRTTNRTPRPGHASYASYHKYGEWDDSIGAGFFSGRYTSSLVAAGAVARRILKAHGIEVFSYVKEAAGVRMSDMDYDACREKTEAFRALRREYDLLHTMVFKEGRIKPGMRFVEKVAVLGEIEKLIPELEAKKEFDRVAAQEKFGCHPVMNCPDADAAEEMSRKIIEIRDSGDSSGGMVEVVVTGVPAGMGEPVFEKLDGELGRMMSIGTIKAVEVGAGMAVKDMTGSECNDQMCMDGDKVAFKSNNAGGILGGLTTAQPIVARLAVKPTPTIAKPQTTIDKVSEVDAALAAVTRRDPTIVARVWPVAEAYTAMIVLDQLMMHLAYTANNKIVQAAQK